MSKQSDRKPPTSSLVELQLCVHTVEKQVPQFTSWYLPSQYGGNVAETLRLQVPQDLVGDQTFLLSQREKRKIDMRKAVRVRGHNLIEVKIKRSKQAEA